MNEMPRGWITFPRGGVFTAIQVPWVSSSLCQAGVKASEVFKTSWGWWLHEAGQDLDCKELSDPESFWDSLPSGSSQECSGAADLGLPCFSQGCSCDFTSARSSVTVRPILIAARELQMEVDFQKRPEYT